VLTQSYTFEPANLTTLVNPDRSSIYQAVRNLRTQVKPVDSVLVFFAGHGHWLKKIEQGYWLPADAEDDNEAQWVSNSDIRDAIRRIDSKHTLLVSDACFSGGIFKTRAAFADPSRAIEELHGLRSRKAMTSGALSTVPDQSAFLHYLVSRLKKNTEPYTVADRLFTSFREAVMNNAPHTPQYGVIQDAGDEGGEFVFVRRDVARATPARGGELGRREELALWQSISETNDVTVLDDYLARVERGELSGLYRAAAAARRGARRWPPRRLHRPWRSSPPPIRGTSNRRLISRRRRGWVRHK
jgi:hypothetical protein